MKRIPKLFCTALVTAVLAPFAASSAYATDAGEAAKPNSALAHDINALLADERLDGAQATVVVKNAKTGEVLYSRDADDRFIPSSNAKLYTSTAALEVLGTDYRFSTTVFADPMVGGGTVKGNLYIKGTGDPSLRPADYDSLAASVAASGVRAVTGNIVGDDTFFDDQRFGAGWSIDDAPYYYQPEISALTVAADDELNVGSIEVVVKPAAKVNGSANVQTNPPTSYVEIVNKATTGPVGSESTLQVIRRLGTNIIDVTGSVPADAEPVSELSTVANPTSYATTLFREALAKHHVAVSGSISTGKTPPNAAVVKQQTSQPLSKLMIPFLKRSNNGIAEILVKAMGKKVADEGSWPAGLAVESKALQQLGVDTGKIKLVDGSGLSRLNLVTAQQTTNLLKAVQKKSWFLNWYNALPIAGNPDPFIGGTLRSRMAGTAADGNVHGKTGSMTGESALSGYVTNADGTRLVFSIMENNYLADSVKSIEDAIAVRLAKHTAAEAAVENAVDEAA